MPNLPKTAIRQNEDQCISGLAIRLPADCRREKETVRGIAGGTKSTTGSAGRIDVHVPCEDIQNAKRIRALTEAADKKHITVTLECHVNTITDCWQSAKSFLSEVSHPRLKMYWQPNQMRDFSYNLSAAEQLADDTVNIHVFHWGSEERYPLAEGEADWKQYLQVFQKTGKDESMSMSTKSTTLSKDKRNHCGKALFCVRLATQDDPP
ncbi:MAG: hypothetical protein PUB00_07250 [Clostridiales bacterium]|nr:hypothetical protein [Clostridiales bacterium]